MLSDMEFLVLILSGFSLMIAGIGVGFITVYMMIGVNNEERPSDFKTPKWHAFVRFLSNDAISLYRRSHHDGPLHNSLKVCRILLGVGFVMVISARCMAP